MRNGLEAGEFFDGSAPGAYVLPVLQVELRIVDFFAAFEFRLVLFLVAEVELDDEWLLADFITVAFAQVPQCLSLIAVEDVVSVQV